MIKSKLPNVETTIFTKMSALASKHEANNLSQGFPDFDIDNKITELYGHYSKKGYNQYAPMIGVEKLINSIAKKVKKDYNVSVDPLSEITITAGATQAIYTAITTLINPDDEAIIFSPAYDSYAPAIELAGGKTHEVKLVHPSFSINWDEVNKLINKKIRLIIINSPHNPTGAVISKDDIRELERIVSSNNIYIISDEVYEHIVFDNKVHHSLLTSDILRKKTFATYSFGKSLHITGWKLGYCIAPRNLMEEFRKVHQYNVFSCNSPAQYAIADYIDNTSPFDKISEIYEKKRDLFLKGIKNSRFKVIPSNGTYFQLLDYSNISNENDVEFAKRITIEHKVASIPISVFYKDKTDDKILRFCFAKKDETLLKATKILCRI